MAIKVEIPVRIESSLNLREHFRKKANRNSSHRASAWFALKGAKVRPALPCTVTLTRIAPRQLDDDNLAGGFKSVRDGIADWLGVDDRDPRVKWRYEQERGKPRQYTAMATIETEEVTTWTA